MDHYDDYHFVIKKLADKFFFLITCLAENTTFTVAIEKQVIAIDKNGKEIPQKYISQIGSY